MESLQQLDEIEYEYENHKFFVYYLSDNNLYFPVYEVCRAIGIDPADQLEKIHDNPNLAEASISWKVRQKYGNSFRMREADCISLKRLPFWLGGLDYKRVKDPEIQTRILKYQKDFADVSYHVFRTRWINADMLAEIDVHDPPDEQLANQAGSVLGDIITEIHQARDVGEFTAGQIDQLKVDIERVAQLQQYLNAAQNELKDTMHRLLHAIDANAPITHEQARQFQDIISALAEKRKEWARQKKAPLTGNPHAYYMDLYKKEFNLDKYQSLRSSEYNDAIAWLATLWRQETHSEPPDELFGEHYTPKLF